MSQPDDEHENSGELKSAEEVASALRVFLLTLAYDGSAYCGWQLQVDQPTVQQAVELALCKVLDLPHVRVHASSRTDTGVHALGQAAVVRTHAWSAPADRLHAALNTRLPADIVARSSVEVPSSFHPLRDSKGKRYRYRVFSSRLQDPIGARTHWWIRRPVSLSAMRDAASRLLGRHDFDSFQSTGSPRSSTVRTVRSLTIEESPHIDGTLYTIEIEADGFLYNMVRNIVGTLVQVGVGRETADWVTSVLAARDRTLAGATAPPQGLTLLEVLF
jgi:tRNA pseudouridine38-40 synthase